MYIFDRDTWREVGQTIGRNKRRSVVTAFGVFWGIFMLIVLLSLSSGLRNGINFITSSLAPNMLFINENNTSLPYDGLPAGRYWSIEVEDLALLKAQAPQIALTSGTKIEWSTQVYHNAQSADTQVMGVLPNFYEVQRVRLVVGRLLSPSDHEEQRKYCLLGKELAEQLFSDPQAALGKSLRVLGTYCTVVGVIEPFSSMVNIGPGVSESVAIPHSVFALYKNYKGLNMSMCTLRAGADHKEASELIKQVLKTQKRIAPEDDKAISIMDLDEMLMTFENINRGIDLLVWIVGIGTLLTGIVGISNILLVTVRERTQEIGVRRAIGAKPNNIIGQLLMEALSLTLLSGLMGLVCGVGVMSLVAEGFRRVENFPFLNPVVELGVVLIALFILVLSGIVAGILPAMKAIEVRAIEAIREE